MCDAWRRGTPGPCEVRPITPAVAVMDRQDAGVVRAQAPGVRKEELQVTISERSLTMTSAMQAEESVGDKNPVVTPRVPVLSLDCIAQWRMRDSPAVRSAG